MIVEVQLWGPTIIVVVASHPCFTASGGSALEVAVVNVVQLYFRLQNPSALLTCSISILQATLRFQFVHVRSWCLEVAILHEVKRVFFFTDGGIRWYVRLQV